MWRRLAGHLSREGFWLGRVCGVVMIALFAGVAARAEEKPAAAPSSSPREVFAVKAQAWREQMLLTIPPLAAASPREKEESSPANAWKRNIVGSLFWVGEGGRRSSCWDENWVTHFGGVDNPDVEARRNFVAVSFTPRLNPFYIALPYNDLAQGSSKPEAKMVVPWYKREFSEEKRSVCRDRWIEMRNPANDRVCYAQWSDAGPQRADHWQYVFGTERPKATGARQDGLSYSPAVCDFLGLRQEGTVDWRFVEFREVPKGPWAKYGENNPFVQAEVKREEARPRPAKLR